MWQGRVLGYWVGQGEPDDGQKSVVIEYYLSRVHRHLVSVFARGIEPLSEDHAPSNDGLEDQTSDQQNLI